jgi:hypothetical protein
MGRGEYQNSKVFPQFQNKCLLSSFGCIHILTCVQINPYLQKIESLVFETKVVCITHFGRNVPTAIFEKYY